MDFIERAFGISPDQGSGLLEYELILAILFGFLIVHYWTRATRHGWDSSMRRKPNALMASSSNRPKRNRRGRSSTVSGQHR